MDGNHNLTDINTPNVIAYVQTLSNGYGIYFTNKAPPQELLASVTIVSNSSFAQMIVTEVIGTNGTPRTIGFNYTSNSASSGTWDVVEGGGLRTQSCITVVDAFGNQTKTIQVKDSNGAVWAQTAEQYTAFPWGLTLVQRTLGTGNSAQTNSWTYYRDTNSLGSYGQLAELMEPSGRWELYQYDATGRLTNTIAQFGNNPTNNSSANRVTQILYNDTNGIKTTIAKILNSEVSRTYEIQSRPQYGVQQVQTIRCAVAGAAITDRANLTNILWRTTDANTTGNAWDPIQELHPDGTMTFYTYIERSSGKTTQVNTGVPDSSGQVIVDGTQTTTVVGQWGQILSSEVQDIASGLSVIDLEAYTYTDDLNRSHTVGYLDLSTETFNYACCGLDTYIDRDGVPTQYSYDAARRQTACTRLGITTTNVLDAAGNSLATIRIGTDTSPITLRQATYDWAGRLTSETNALGGATLYSQAFDGSGQTVKTTTHPDGGTRVETYYQDGTLLSVGGTAAHSVQYLYGADTDGAFTTEIKVTGSGGTNEWVKTSTDMLGRSYRSSPDLNLTGCLVSSCG